ncbi:MAG: ATP-binding protein [Gemmatimonadota bacterium]
MSCKLPIHIVANNRTESLQSTDCFCCNKPIAGAIFSQDEVSFPPVKEEMDYHYKSRVIDAELATRLSSTGAVLIEGPKASGKTSTARQFAASEVLLDVDENARRAIAIDPTLVLDGEVPRLIDEWQIEPAIWNHVRRMVDDRKEPGQFILTGSALPSDDVTRHGGAGRLTRLHMRPMSFFETGHSTGAVSVRALLDGIVTPVSDSGLTMAAISERIAVGGWPGHLDRTVRQSVQAVRDYLEEIRGVDIGRLDQTRRDPDKVGRLLRSLARNIATFAATTTLAADTRGAEGPLDVDTVRAYLTALERLMILEDQPAWAPHLRSKSRLRQAPKRHFVDPSLAVAALRATPERLLGDLNLFGFLFESLVIRDLRVYAQAADARVLQYRDNTGLEVDAILEAEDGRWAAFEIKLGPRLVDEATENLLTLAERVDTRKSGEPAVLAVIVGTGYGYMRDDGVAVIPIGALGP